MLPRWTIRKAGLVALVAIVTLLAAATLTAKAQSISDPGRMAYQRACAACHLPNLAGSGPSPGLVGAEFKARWQNLTGADLLERISTTMPVGRPGALKPAEYRAITVYLLNANHVKTPSPDADERALSQVIIK